MGDYVVVGGVERPAGGWVEYEHERREAVRAGAGKLGGGSQEYYGGLDAAESLLRAVPGDGAGVVGGAEQCLAAGAVARLGEAVARLRDAAADPSWWDHNTQVSVPGEDFEALVAEVAEAGHATPEMLARAVDAAELVAVYAATEATADAPSVVAAELRRLVADAQEARRALLATPAHRRGSEAAPGDLEEAAVPYASAVERANARAAAYVDAAAAALGARLGGPAI